MKHPEHKRREQESRNNMQQNLLKQDEPCKNPLKLLSEQAQTLTTPFDKQAHHVVRWNDSSSSPCQVRVTSQV